MWNHQDWHEFLWLSVVQVLCLWFYNYSQSKKKSCDQPYWDQNWKLTSLVEITSMTLQGPLANYKVGDYAAPSCLNWQLNLLRSIIIPLLSSVTLANDSGELEGFSGWVLMSLFFFLTTECHQFKSCQCALFQVAKTPLERQKISHWPAASAVRGQHEPTHFLW